MSRVMKTSKRMNRLGITGLLISLLLFSLSNESVFGHDDGAYCHDSNIGTIGISKVDWMRRLPDDLHISELSIPGTHETMALYGVNPAGDVIEFLMKILDSLDIIDIDIEEGYGSEVGKCQTAPLLVQLEAGIRAFDIRCRHIEDVFTIHHERLYQNATFGNDVLAVCRSFLADHPSETIIMRVKKEWTEENCSRTFEETFLQEYWNPYKYLFWDPSSSSYPDNPTLGEVRGKVVVLQNFPAGSTYGIRWIYPNKAVSCYDDIQDTSLNIQDKWEVPLDCLFVPPIPIPTSKPLSWKWGWARDHLYGADYEAGIPEIAKCHIFINFISGVGGGRGGLLDICAEVADKIGFMIAPPFFVASGHITPGTSDRHWPDCEGLNTLTYNYIKNGQVTKRVGIVLADFPGKRLIDAIINVNPLNLPPVADANGPYKGYEGSAITFNASASFDPDGDILQYRWDFGNDGTWDTGWSNNPKASHTWYDDYSNSSGVKLEVSDGQVTDTATANVTVNNVAPTVNAGSDATVNEGQLFEQLGSFTDPGTDTWSATVNYGDGTGQQALMLNGKGFELNHVYADNSIYSVTVTVTDDDGGAGSDTLTVTVNNVAPTVAAGPDRTVAEGETLTLAPSTFNDKGTLDTHTATIDWGDGSPVENGTVTESPFGPPGSTAGADGTAAFGGHEYGDNGTYIVTVTVTDDDGGAGSDTLTVTVNNVAPTAKIDDYTSPVEGSILPGQEVTFDGSFTDPGWLDLHTSQWNFGDGSIVAGTLTEENGKPDATGTVSDKHIYADPGTYTVVLKVTDDDGGIGTDQTEVKVMTASEAIDFANNYIQNLEEDSFRGQAEQRKQAFSNKFEAVKNAIAADALVGAINNLRNDIRSKADGSVDGKSQDDWVTDKEAQGMICLMVDELVKYLESLQEEKDKPMVAKADNEDKDKAEAAPAAQRMLPERTRLLACFPNPGNPEVWIPYQLSTDSQVVIRIYDMTGRLVRTLDLGHKPTGFYASRSKAAYWDGSNEAGERVASGIYFYNLQAGDFAATRKLIIKK